MTENSATAAKMVTVPIDHLVTHTSFHLDEAEAIRLVRKYGEQKFPGVSRAHLRFTEGMEQKPDSFFDSVKMLPVGCVPGTRYNDKDASGKRIPGACTTTIVSRDLGLETDIVLKCIADEVLRCDSQAGVRNTELAELIKMAHRRLAQASNEAVFKWATEILEAIHTQLIYRFAASSGERTLRQIFNQLAAAGHFPNERAGRKLAALVDESLGRQEAIMELAFIASALQRVGHPTAIDHVRFGLEHLYADQVAFWEAVAECRRPKMSEGAGKLAAIAPLPDWAWVKKGLNSRKPEELKVLLIHSDNPLIVRASRHTDAGFAAVTVTRNKRGNVAVFTDSRRQLDLGDFVAMVRWLELPKASNGWPLVELSWEALQAEGELKEVPKWYYFRKAGQFFNGSLSRPEVEPTEIYSQAFLDIARHAFTKSGVDAWKRRRGIPVESEAARSPLENSLTVGLPAETTAVQTDAGQRHPNSLTHLWDLWENQKESLA